MIAAYMYGLVATAAASSWSPETLLDTLIFGNQASEAVHQLDASGMDAAAPVRGGTCRSPCQNAATCRSGWPTNQPSITFRMKVDPAKQTYLTVKFDGSAVSSSTQLTVLNQSFSGAVSDGGYPPEINMCFGTGDGVSENHCADPVFQGRWQYSTMLIPVQLTAGSMAANLTLTTVAGQSIQDIFRAYTHTSALPPLPVDETQPPAPPPAPPMPTPPSFSGTQFDYLLAEVDRGTEQMMAMQLWGDAWSNAVSADPAKGVLTGGIWPHVATTDTVNSVNFSQFTKDRIKDECLGNSVGSNNNWFRGLEVMARAYRFSGSKYYRSPDVLARIVAGVDFYQLAQGQNGGFDPRPRLSAGWIGAPQRRNASGCLEGYGHMGISAAIDLIASDLTNETLSQMVDADDTGQKTMSRRDAWTRLLVNSRDYLQWNRGHAPNQDLADVLAAQIADSALATIAPEQRISRAAMLRGAKQAVGILAQPSDDGPWKPAPGTGPVTATDPGFWFSKHGISMEPNTNVNGGYSHGYGDEEWALGWLAQLLNDDEITEVAARHVRNFGRFRQEDNCMINTTSLGAVSARCMRLESAITWVRPTVAQIDVADLLIVYLAIDCHGAIAARYRLTTGMQRHNKNPGSISYGAGDPGAFMALSVKEPTSIRLAQLRMEHAQAYALDVSSDTATRSPHWPDLLASTSIWLASFEEIAKLPPTDFRLPMEASSPDFAWADVQAGAVAVKHGGVRLFASLQWRHGFINEHAPRVPANVVLNNVTRVHYTVLDNSNTSSGVGNGSIFPDSLGYGPSVDHILNVQMQRMDGNNAGWARLYATQPIGDFIIALNGAADATLLWEVPPTVVGSDALDLISGTKHCGVGPTLPIEALTAVVLRRITC